MIAGQTEFPFNHSNGFTNTETSWQSIKNWYVIRSFLENEISESYQRKISLRSMFLVKHTATFTRNTKKSLFLLPNDIFYFLADEKGRLKERDMTHTENQIKKNIKATCKVVNCIVSFD